MALIRTDYGLIYNTDGSLCATLLPEGGVAVEEATENVLIQSGESSQPWSRDTDDVTLTQSTDYVRYGNYSIKWTKASKSDTRNAYLHKSADIDQSKTSTVWTFSCYVRRADGKPVTNVGHVYLYLNSAESGARLNINEGPTAIVDCGDGWYRVIRTDTVSEPAYVELVGFSALDGTTDWYFDGWQLEAKPFATSFVDGTRAAGRLVYPTSFNMNEGTIHVWFYFNGTTARNTLRGTIFRTKQGSGGLRNHFWLFTSTEPGSNSLQFQVRTDDGSALITQNIKHFSDISDGWHSAVVRWSTSAQSLDVFLDGQLLTSYTYPIDGLLPFDAIDVGCRDTTDQSNTLIDELLICPYAVSPETIATWHSLDAPFFDPREQIDASGRPVYAPGLEIDSKGLRSSNGSFSIGTDGNAYFGGILEANIVKTEHIQVGAVSDIQNLVVTDAQGYHTHSGEWEDIPNFQISFTLNEPTRVIVTARINARVRNYEGSSNTNVAGYFRLLRRKDGGSWIELTAQTLGIHTGQSGLSLRSSVILTHTDNELLETGNYTYKVQMQSIGTGVELSAFHRELIAMLLLR